MSNFRLSTLLPCLFFVLGIAEFLGVACDSVFLVLICSFDLRGCGYWRDCGSPGLLLSEWIEWVWLLEGLRQPGTTSIGVDIVGVAIGGGVAGRGY